MKDPTPDITEVITSVEAALNYLGATDPEVIIYNKILPVFKDEPENHLLNYQTAVVLIRAINEKKEPDWDSNESKYYNYFIMGSSGFRFGVCVHWTTASSVGSRLCFFQPNHGRHLVEKFPDVFKNFMLINK